MAAQELPLHLRVEDTPRATPSQHAASHKGLWFFQGMGLAALMLIGVYSMGGLESPAGSETPSGHGAAVHAFNPPVNGMRTGGLRAAATGGLEASAAVLDASASRAARVEAGASPQRLPQYFELVPSVTSSRSGYPSMSEAEQEKVVAEASAVIEKEVQDVAAAFDGVVQEVKKQEVGKEAEGGGSATAVAEKPPKEKKEDPKTQTIRTAMTAPFYTKEGQEQWKQISIEENARRKETADKNDYKNKMDSTSSFNKVRNGLTGVFPGWVSRGFTDAWADDEAGVVQPKGDTKRASVDPATFDPKLKEMDKEAWISLPFYTKSGQQQWKDRDTVRDGDMVSRDDALAWSNAGLATSKEGYDSMGRREDVKSKYKDGTFEGTSAIPQGTRKAPPGQAPFYWRWALPFVSDAAWEGRLDESKKKVAAETPWWTAAGLEKWAVGAISDDEGKWDPLFTDSLFADPSSRRAKLDASQEKIVENLPAPWTKAGVEYASKNGIGQYVDEYNRNYRIKSQDQWEKTFGGESKVDANWGKITEEEDPLKDNSIINTLKALSVASRERYGNYESVPEGGGGFGGPVFKTDPWEKGAILVTLRALSTAFAERLQLDKAPRTFKTDAITMTFLELWEKNAERYGADTADIKKLVSELRAEKSLTGEEQNESNDAIIRTLQDLSAGAANWSDTLKKDGAATREDGAIIKTLQDVSAGQSDPSEPKKDEAAAGEDVVAIGDVEKAAEAGEDEKAAEGGKDEKAAEGGEDEKAAEGGEDVKAAAGGEDEKPAAEAPKKGVKDRIKNVFGGKKGKEAAEEA